LPNLSDVSLPVKIRLVFEGGKIEEKEWSGDDGVFRISGQGPKRLPAAAIDPDERYALDVNRLNNIRTVSCNTNRVMFCTG